MQIKIQHITNFKLLFNFIIPNIKSILKHRVSFNSLTVYQNLFIQGPGQIVIHPDCIFGYPIGGRFKNGYIELQSRYKKAEIVIGRKVATNNNLFICAANYIEIGEETRIGEGVTIMDFEAHGIAPAERSKPGAIGKIIIGKNVWIGNKVTILKNVTIGDNTIIAAGAVVTNSFPANSIIGGVPAKLIKNIES